MLAGMHNHACAMHADSSARHVCCKHCCCLSFTVLRSAQHLLPFGTPSSSKKTCRHTKLLMFLPPVQCRAAGRHMVVVTGTIAVQHQDMHAPWDAFQLMYLGQQQTPCHLKRMKSTHDR
jgi:hypothetical protein